MRWLSLKSMGSQCGRNSRDGLPLIQGDRVQLQQVVLNLILNAVQAMGAVVDRTREVLITTSQTEPNAVCLGGARHRPRVERGNSASSL